MFFAWVEKAVKIITGFLDLNLCVNGKFPFKVFNLLVESLPVP